MNEIIAAEVVTTATRSHRAGRTRRLLLGTGTALLAATVVAMPASAYTRHTSGSYPGSVIGYQVQGSHYDTCTSPYITCFTPWVVGTGPLVYRSPASTGTQKIVAVYQLQQWTGSSWRDHSQRQFVRYLQPGYGRIQMPRLDWLPTGGGYFRVDVAVGWGNQDGSRNFGTVVLAYDRVGDYVCNTRFPCSANGPWVWLRSPGV